MAFRIFSGKHKQWRGFRNEMTRGSPPLLVYYIWNTSKRYARVVEEKLDVLVICIVSF